MNSHQRRIKKRKFWREIHAAQVELNKRMAEGYVPKQVIRFDPDPNPAPGLIWDYFWRHRWDILQKQAESLIHPSVYG